MHVACYVERYDDEEPQIGTIVALHERSVEVEWMTGAYDDRWSVCKQTVGRKNVPWVEKISQNEILCPVQLTFYKRLKKDCITKLRETYEKIKQQK